MAKRALAIIMTATTLTTLQASAIPPAMLPEENVSAVPALPTEPAGSTAKSRATFNPAPVSPDSAGFGFRSRLSGADFGAMTAIVLHQDSRRAGRFGFGSLGLSGELALGPPISLMRRDAGFDSLDWRTISHWLDRSRSRRVVTLGYAWRDLTVEGSAFGTRANDTEPPPQGEQMKFTSRSTRLSYQPLPALLLQLSRGTVSRLDQLVPHGDVRRTTLSATYTRNFTGGEWQTTFAWGRNARKTYADTTGYLAETTVRFAGSHTAFGRLEQVGSDELYNEDPISRRPFTKVNKLTIGYYRDLHHRGVARLGAGAIASRHFMPASHLGAYGRDPTTYMLFVRLSLQ